ncbi:hypothetical protein [Shewanella xiamenensis]|uniref:hypothetical protein n=1 Tax=Shewanella xiamenensis TaxID=332186 RepID=UPI0004D555B3|nr:hypothetical protein [Shewanella xiamenensis]KEK26737.1 hypothetical protein SXM_3839 [Shewanella xiamenensis]
MSAVSKDQLIKLEASLARGKWYFILVIGVLYWGSVTSLLVAGFQYFTAETPFWLAMKVALYIYPASGVLFGWTLWMQLNHRRDKLRGKYRP